MAEIQHDRIIDSETRLQIVGMLTELTGMSQDDTALLFFLAMGDVKDVASQKEVLKRVKLPRVRSKYNRNRIRELATMMADRMKEMDQYGILDLKTDPKILKESWNGEYITVFGVKVLPWVYHNIWRMLYVKQDYMIDTILGLKEALDAIVKFLQIEKE